MRLFFSLKVTWNWRATHENPYYEDNKNESLVEYYPSNDNLLSCTYENWVFGEDYTGNICDSSNIRFLIKKCEQLGEVSFITADGSINTHLQPKQKENILYILHYSELVAALSILSDGGNFVWKVFTIFQENMISLLYLLNLVFGKITLFKPLSGPVHSFEMFVVCQNFQKRTTNLDELLEQMINSVGNKNPIFPKDFIPQAFLQEHLEKMKYFTSNQLALLRKFLMFARDPHGTEARRHLSISKQVAWEFFRHYNISPISQRNRLINFENSYKTLTTIQGGLRIEDLALTVEEINSFNEIDNIQRKEIVCRKLWAFGPKIHPYNRESELPKINVLELDPICGKPIENVTSSMFIVTIPFKVGLLIEQQFQGSLLGLSGLDVSCLVGTTEVKFEFHENFGKSEKKFLKTILEKFIQMKPNRILFQNFYFLTHFAVSVLATFMFFYEECAMDESNVFLRKYLDYGYSDEIILLQKILDSDTFDNIVSLVPPNRIQRNRFAVKLIHFNTFLLTSHLKKFVQNL